VILKHLGHFVVNELLVKILFALQIVDGSMGARIGGGGALVFVFVFVGVTLGGELLTISVGRMVNAMLLVAAVVVLENCGVVGKAAVAELGIAVGTCHMITSSVLCDGYAAMKAGAFLGGNDDEGL